MSSPSLSVSYSHSASLSATFSLFLSLALPVWLSHAPDKDMLRACDQKQAQAMEAVALAGPARRLWAELSHTAQMKEQIEVDQCS